MVNPDTEKPREPGFTLEQVLEVGGLVLFGIQRSCRLDQVPEKAVSLQSKEGSSSNMVSESRIWTQSGWQLLNYILNLR